MRPQYITIVGGVQKVVALDSNMVGVNISVRTDATTVEVSVEAPNDSVSTNNIDPPVNPSAPNWVAAPAAGTNGLIVLQNPVAAIRFTKATNGTATILQQGIR